MLVEKKSYSIGCGLLMGQNKFICQCNGFDNLCTRLDMNFFLRKKKDGGYTSYGIGMTKLFVFFL